MSPLSHYNWIPSNIWVGVGLLRKCQVTLPLACVYGRAGIKFCQARAVAIHPEGNGEIGKPAVEIEWTLDAKAGQRELIAYDFLVNATGPRLNFAATEGLGPRKNSLSVCGPR